MWTSDLIITRWLRTSHISFCRPSSHRFWPVCFLQLLCLSFKAFQVLKTFFFGLTASFLCACRTSAWLLRGKLIGKINSWPSAPAARRELKGQKMQFKHIFLLRDDTHISVNILPSSLLSSLRSCCLNSNTSSFLIYLHISSALHLYAGISEEETAFSCKLAHFSHFILKSCSR